MAESLTIRQLREALGLSPLDIEQRTAGAVKRGALNAIERGTVRSPTYATVSALAHVLGIDTAACSTAIAASVAARAGLPAAPVPATRSLEAALESARQVVAALEEQLARSA